MDPLTLVLAVTALFSFVAGPLLARASMRREPIYSGSLAKFFNAVAAMAFVGILPGALCSLVTQQATTLGIPLALALFATAFIALVLFALLELPARKPHLKQPTEDDEVWTAERARTSGL